MGVIAFCIPWRFGIGVVGVGYRVGVWGWGFVYHTVQYVFMIVMVVMVVICGSIQSNRFKYRFNRRRILMNSQ